MIQLFYYSTPSCCSPCCFSEGPALKQHWYGVSYRVGRHTSYILQLLPSPVKPVDKKLILLCAGQLLKLLCGSFGHAELTVTGESMK